jgi:hypothetical protein
VTLPRPHATRSERPGVPHQRPAPLELAGGLEPATCCLQDRSGSSTAYWRVLSWQLRSGALSSQYAPDVPSIGWWNDKRNDIRPLHPRPVDSMSGARPRRRLGAAALHGTTQPSASSFIGRKARHQRLDQQAWRGSEQCCSGPLIRRLADQSGSGSGVSAVGMPAMSALASRFTSPVSSTTRSVG